MKRELKSKVTTITETSKEQGFDITLVTAKDESGKVVTINVNGQKNETVDGVTVYKSFTANQTATGRNVNFMPPLEFDPVMNVAINKELDLIMGAE